MSAADVVPVVPRRRGRSWFIGCTTLIVGFLAIVVGLYLYARHRADLQLRTIISTIEAKDPRWRLADIEADREQLPDAENAALVALAVRGLLPGSGLPPADLDIPGEGVEPNHLLRVKTAADLRKELEKYPAAIAKARTLADLDRGRYPITYAPDFISTLLPHAQQAREVAWLTMADSAQLAEQGDIDKALRSSRAGLVVGRTLNDEPMLISQLVRIACVAIAANAAERALGKGEATDAELAALQALCAREDGRNILQQAMRGERAGMHETANMVEAGKLSMTALVGGTGSSKMAERLMMLGRGTWLRREHAQLLEAMTEYIETTNLPPPERLDRLDKLEQETRVMPPGLASLLLPAVGKVAEAAQRHQSTVRTLNVLLAVERYRKANGKWPETVAELVPAYLPDVPLDPYDGKPIRLRRTEFGVIVYCLGEDRKDDQGEVPYRPHQPGTDLGFRLWDLDKRRQPAPPPPPDEPLDLPFGPPGPGENEPPEENPPNPGTP